MKHFSIDDCIDFVRHTEDADQKMKIQQHLEAGCTECSKTLEIWRRVMDLANRETSYEPPARAVQAVNAGFAVSRAIPHPAGKLELARLLFDSALQPIALGVRGTASVVRQLLYRSGSMCIDMRMQPKPGSDSMVLIGQLMDSAKPDHGIGGIPVSLLSKGDTVSRVRTNDVGEFDFGIAALSSLQLVFGIGDTRTIVVPVPDGESSRGLM
jgi:hypothetical protein